MSRLQEWRWREYERNFVAFNFGLNNRENLAVKRLSRFSMWYYHPGLDLFAPQRFLGYFETTQANYDGWSSGNESKTLPTYFEMVGEDTNVSIYEKLNLFAKNLGFKLNSLSYVNIPKQDVLQKFVIDKMADVDSDVTMLESELSGLDNESEGSENRVLISRFERDPKLRKLAIIYHGTTCMVCGFDFEKYYGPQGKGYIDVHHLIPLAQIREKHVVNPTTDMAVVCANCHRMLHRHRNTVVSIDDLRKQIKKPFRALWLNY